MSREKEYYYQNIINMYEKCFLHPNIIIYFKMRILSEI